MKSPTENGRHVPVTRSVIVGTLAAATLTGVLLLGYLWGARRASEPTGGPQVDEPALASQDSDHEEGPRWDRQALRMEPHPSGDPVPVADQPAEEPSLSPAEAREQQLARLASSGPDRRNLIVSARQVGDEWVTLAKKAKLDVSMDEWRCHQSGCFVNMRHGSSAALDEMTEQITHSPAFHRWNAGKMRTGEVEKPGGKLEVSWVLFAPASGEPAFQQGTFAGAGEASSPAAANP